MNRRSTALLGLLLASGAGCSDGHSASPEARDEATNVEHEPFVPAGFDQVDTPCNFHFYAPPGIQSIPAEGIDSCIVQFELPDCTLIGAAGAYSSKLADVKEEEDYEEERVRIDGRSSRLARYLRRDGLYGTAVHVPISDEGGWYISIDLQASCATAQRRDEMRDVLLSIDPNEDW